MAIYNAIMGIYELDVEIPDPCPADRRQVL